MIYGTILHTKDIEGTPKLLYIPLQADHDDHNQFFFYYGKKLHHLHPFGNIAYKTVLDQLQA